MSVLKTELVINDSFIYTVTMVVAIPNYSTTFDDKYNVSALDVILNVISNEPEITVLDSNESKLGLWVTE